MSSRRIPFNRPFVVGKELFYISQAVLQGHLAADGPFSARCQAWMESSLGVRRALLTPSCTAALEIAAILCGLGPGDEVILPSYTFVTTATAFAQQGATLRWIDVREDTLNLDERLIDGLVNPRTRVIVPVHYGGVGCEMDAILAVATRHDLLVIEDAAQGFGARYRGRPLGAFGALGCYSFHETKNVIAGEAGALVVNEPRLLERAEIVRQKGTNRSQFLRGEADKYTWVDVGSSFVPSELTAAFLLAQLEAYELITQTRRKLWQRYHGAFAHLEAVGRVRRPIVPPHCDHNAHMYYLLCDSQDARDGLIRHLAAREIHAVFHYVPLHSSPYARKLQHDVPALPVTDRVSACLVRLPCYFELTEADQARVVEGVTSFFAG